MAFLLGDFLIGGFLLSDFLIGGFDFCSYLNKTNNNNHYY